MGPTLAAAARNQSLTRHFICKRIFFPRTRISLPKNRRRGYRGPRDPNRDHPHSTSAYTVYRRLDSSVTYPHARKLRDTTRNAYRRNMHTMLGHLRGRPSTPFPNQTLHIRELAERPRRTGLPRRFIQTPSTRPLDIPHATTRNGSNACRRGDAH